MSSSRNKRKRGEIDNAATPTPSRRRTRDQRAATPDPETTTDDNNKNNEEETNNNDDNNNNGNSNNTSDNNDQQEQQEDQQQSEENSASTKTKSSAIADAESSSLSPTSSKEPQNAGAADDDTNNNNNDNNTSKLSSTKTEPAVEKLKSNATQEVSDSATIESPSKSTALSSSTSDPSSSSAATSSLTTKTSADPGPESDQIAQSANLERSKTTQQGSNKSESNAPPESNEIIQDVPKGNSRESKIQALILHRKILLERMRHCRTAATNRIQETDAIIATIKPSKDNIKSKNKADKTNEAKQQEVMTDEQEVLAFKDMTKKATNSSKKRSSDVGDLGPGEKRTSLSLRRGASVGKRMNAALSSLAPGTSGSSSVRDATAVQPLHVTSSQSTPATTAPTLTPTPTPTPSAKTPTGTVPPPAPINSISSSTSSSTKIMRTSLVSTSSTGSKKSSTKIPSSQHLQSLSDQSSLTQLTQQARYEATTQKNRALTPKATKVATIPTNNRATSSNAKLDSMTVPQHMGTSASTLPPNRLAQQKVEFPEAIALRKRRDEIIAKLNKLVDNKQTNKVEMGKHKSESISHSTRKSNKDIQKGNRVPLTFQSPDLHHRRRTHWDYLLEEMRWMATDFIEERKWKLSSARTVGSVAAETSMRNAGISAGINNEVSYNQSTVTSRQTNRDTTLVTTENDSDSHQKDSSASMHATSQARYKMVTDEDVLACRTNASIMSKMIHELSTVTSSSERYFMSQKASIEALDRFKKAREVLLQDANSPEPSDQSNIESKLKQQSKSEHDKMDVDANSKILSFQEISSVVDDLISASNNQSTSKSRISSLSKIPGLKLTAQQKDIVTCIDRIWKIDNSPGVVYSGNRCSGKTITVCTVLWKEKSRGAQLLICSAQNSMRWMHELSRFKGVRVLCANLPCGISNPFEPEEEITDIKSGDVIVCDFSMVPHVLKIEELHLHSIVVDGRCQKTVWNDINSLKQFSIEATQVMLLPWWDDLFKYLTNKPINRVLLEVAPNHNAKHSVSHTSGVNVRSELRSLALKAAFVLGPNFFSSTNYPLYKNVLSWARRWGPQSIKDKAKRVKNSLSDILKAFSCETQPDERFEKHGNNILLNWQIKKCSMNNSQREMYDKCCIETRGLLSSSLVSLYNHPESLHQSLNGIALSVLQFRKLTFHEEMDSLVARLVGCPVNGNCNNISYSQIANAWMMQKGHYGPSQPNSEISMSILKGSAKLCELIQFLTEQCNHDIADKSILKGFTDFSEHDGSDTDESTDDQDPKKVAIVAALPEVQLLISLLLSSVGIKHELLMLDTTDPMVDGVQFSGYQSTTFFLAEYQTHLSRFNSEDDDYATNLVVTTPTIAAAGFGGLGIENADVIISIDEDWSGRGQELYIAMTERWFARNPPTNGDTPHLIRFVCADSVEEKLCGMAENNNTATSDTTEDENNVWSLNHLGHVTLPESLDKAVLLYKATRENPVFSFHEFPFRNLFNVRGLPLTKVLQCSKPLPQGFQSGKEPLFLPFASERGSPTEVEAEIAFMRLLLRMEEQRHIHTHRESFHAKTSMVCYVPPTPPHVPSLEFVMRQDLIVYRSRLCFERQTKIESLSQVASSKLQTDGSENKLDSDGDPTCTEPQGIVDTTEKNIDELDKAGPIGDPKDTAISFLVYKGADDDDGDDDKLASDENLFLRKSQQGSSQRLASSTQPDRRNAYASTFSNISDTRAIRDGNQGLEPLIYFPPLFPTLLSAATMAKHSMLGSGGSTHQSETLSANNDHDASLMANNDLLSKRKVRDIGEVAEVPNSKRLKSQQPSGPLPANVSATVLPFASKNGDDKQHRATVKKSRRDQTNVDKSDTDGISISIGLDEDYGLIGNGTIGHPDGIATAAANASIETINSQCNLSGLWDDLTSPILPCDIEESESAGKIARSSMNSDSVVLIVKNLRGQNLIHDHTSSYRHHASSLHVSDNSWGGVPGSTPKHPPPLVDANGALTTKKPKKKTQAQTPVVQIPATLTARTSSIGPTPLPPAVNPVQARILPTKNEDSFQQRVLATFQARQMRTGLSMFESPGYRIASNNIHKRISDRLNMYSWKFTSAYEMGPGIPLAVAKKHHGASTSPDAKVTVRDDSNNNNSNQGWTSLVRRSKSTDVGFGGETAKSLSTSQRSSLRRSLVSPCRVDFGPFGSGFLALPAGMTGISPPRTRVGVSLPMGVKVPQALREQMTQPWTTEDDQLLQDCAVRFGMNWMLVARALSGLEDTVMAKKSVPSASGDEESRTIPRSARQCRDRWQALAKSRPSLASEVRISERVLRESALMKVDKIQWGTDASRYTSISQSTYSGGNLSFLSKPTLFPSSGSDSTKLPDGLSAVDFENALADWDSDLNETKIDFLSDEKIDLGVSPSKDIQSLGLDDALTDKRRSFDSFLQAKSKKQVFPMAIPGVASGSPPSFAPTHPSHMQSVQSSIASQWSNGRTEMWPLQILDCADKQRTASAQQQSTNQASSSSSPPNASNGTRRQASIGSASHRSSSQEAPPSNNSSSSASQRDRNSHFPSVPASSNRTSSHQRQQQQQQQSTASPQRSPRNSTAAPTQAYAPPPPAPPPPQADPKPRGPSGVAAPPGS